MSLDFLEFTFAVVSASILGVALFYLFMFLGEKATERKERIENETMYDLWVNGKYELTHTKSECQKIGMNLEWKHSREVVFDREKKNCWITVK